MGVQQVPEKGKLLVKSRSDLFARGPKPKGLKRGKLVLSKRPRRDGNRKRTPAPGSCGFGFSQDEAPTYGHNQAAL